MIKQRHTLKSVCGPYHSCAWKQPRLQYLWFWFLFRVFSTILWHRKWNIQLVWLFNSRIYFTSYKVLLSDIRADLAAWKCLVPGNVWSKSCSDVISAPPSKRHTLPVFTPPFKNTLTKPKHFLWQIHFPPFTFLKNAFVSSLLLCHQTVSWISPQPLVDFPCSKQTVGSNQSQPLWHLQRPRGDQNTSHP